ncbi:MAG: integrase core domain-containing protein [Dehalococcoidia bacterium]
MAAPTTRSEQPATIGTLSGADRPLHRHLQRRLTGWASASRWGRVGSALDNAVIESWHSTLEFELRGVEQFPTKPAARAAVAAFIDDHNRDRRHSALGMTSPISYELTRHDQDGPEEAA